MLSLEKVSETTTLLYTIEIQKGLLTDEDIFTFTDSKAVLVVISTGGSTSKLDHKKKNLKCLLIAYLMHILYNLIKILNVSVSSSSI